ncbi:Ff.00g065310.m01.CDS01 [Fusarium sp. VM40]|nr:Ff.00g065310.m01.CDS01 [Fusarium sp. VM40]
MPQYRKKKVTSRESYPTRRPRSQGLEQDKDGDAAMLKMLLNAQFNILTWLSDTLAMDEEETVAYAKEIVNLEGAGEIRVPRGQLRNRLV